MKKRDFDNILEIFKSKYAERHEIQVEQIDTETLEILWHRANRICNGRRGLNEKTEESSVLGDSSLFFD
jgi:hypothetical protein